MIKSPCSLLYSMEFEIIVCMNTHLYMIYDEVMAIRMNTGSHSSSTMPLFLALQVGSSVALLLLFFLCISWFLAVCHCIKPQRYRINYNGCIVLYWVSSVTGKVDCQRVVSCALMLNQCCAPQKVRNQIEQEVIKNTRAFVVNDGCCCIMMLCWLRRNNHCFFHSYLLYIDLIMPQTYFSKFYDTVNSLLAFSLQTFTLVL